MSFSVTHEDGEGPAYDVRWTTLRYPNRTVEAESSFTSTLAEDVFHAVSEGTPPEGDRPTADDHAHTG